MLQVEQNFQFDDFARNKDELSTVDERKMFVGGLNYDTTEDDLKSYFERFGEIDSVTLKVNPFTGLSRCFAFIVFNDTESVNAVINYSKHVINGKRVDPKRARSKHGKIFVGGITQDLSDEDIKDYFSQFGSVIEVQMPFDKMKHQRKPFCFITFESASIVKSLVEKPHQIINGVQVEVKMATSKANENGNPRSFNQRGGQSSGGMYVRDSYHRNGSRGGNSSYERVPWSSGNSRSSGGYDYGNAYSGSSDRSYGYDDSSSGRDKSDSPHGRRGSNKRHQPY